MQISVSSTLTIYHDGQFWVGIIEHVENGRLGFARIIFGSEPSDEEVLHFVAHQWETLSFYGSVEPEKPKLAKNPKRRMRDAAKKLKKPAMSTKSQQALSDRRAAMKNESSRERRRRRQEDKQTRFALRSEKRKKKHRGH